MMGAAVYEASEQIVFKKSEEYLHKPRRFGEPHGIFKREGFPVGEFSYKDLKAAYGENATAASISTLDTYGVNTFFCPSMSNLEDETEKKSYPFSHFSEANNRMAVSLAPYVVKGLEENGYACAYTHIAKGGVPIKYYLEGDAADYFYEKTADFFAECAVRYAEDDMSEKVLVWLQGESDAKNGVDYYVDALEKLWHNAKKAGFTRFFLVRVGYFGGESITDVMRAQEAFCEKTADAYMVTRVGSYFRWVGQEDGWLSPELSEDFSFCRDSFYGFGNQHINEKGFRMIAEYAVPNMIRVLFEGKEPILETEMVLPLRTITG